MYKKHITFVVCHDKHKIIPDMRNIALVCIVTLFVGCEKEEIDNPKRIYGLSYPSFNPVQSTEPDSIVKLDISTGQYRSL